MDMNRRGFLKLIGAVPLVIAAPSLGRLWVPEVPQEIALPMKPVIDASQHGEIICGWLFTAAMGDPEDYRRILLEDAHGYFPLTAPLMVLHKELVERRGRGFRRFIWRGNGAPIARGEEMKTIAVWANLGELADLR